MKFPNSRATNGYLFFFEKTEDSVKFDQYLSQQVEECTKLGDKSYVGFFPERHQDTYERLKTDVGLDGKIVWVSLHPFDVT